MCSSDKLYDKKEIMHSLYKKIICTKLSNIVDVLSGSDLFWVQFAEKAQSL
jgi:hypothetical protein